MFFIPISPFSGVTSPTAPWVATPDSTRAEDRGCTRCKPGVVTLRHALARDQHRVCDRLLPGNPSEVGEPGILASVRPVDVWIVWVWVFQFNVDAGGPYCRHPIHCRVVPDVGKLHVAMRRHLNQEEGCRQQPVRHHLPCQVGGNCTAKECWSISFYLPNKKCLS